VRHRKYLNVRGNYRKPCSRISKGEKNEKALS
jgi:ribosomal protein S13